MPSQAPSRIGAFGGWARAAGSSGTLWLRPRGQAEAKLKDEEKRMARRLESQARSTCNGQQTTCTVQRACSLRTRQPTACGTHDATYNAHVAAHSTRAATCNTRDATYQRARTSASLQIAQIEAKKDEEAAQLPTAYPAALGTQQHTPHQMWAESWADVGRVPGRCGPGASPPHSARSRARRQ